MNFDLSKREFRDASRLRYDWAIPDSPSVCVCGCDFNADHAMICQRGGLIIQRHNEIRDLEAELLDMVCHDVAVEPTLQPLTGEELNRGANTAPDARLDVHCCGFWERQRAAFFDIRVCHPNADSYRDLTPNQVYKRHEDEKKRKYASRVLEVEQGTFTPLVFTTTGGMSDECQRYHSRLAELISAKKQENYATTMSWIRTKVSFAILRTALVCLRGTTIPAKSFWPPSEESPPPLPLFQCYYNDVDFSFDIFLNLQNNIGQGVWGKGSHCPMLLSEIVNLDKEEGLMCKRMI